MITSLGGGGAEAMLERLVARSAAAGIDARVITLAPAGPLADGVRRHAPVRDVAMRPARPDPRAFAALVRMLRDDDPDVVQTWLHHADLFGGIAARTVRRPVVWNLRQSSFDRRRSKKLSMLVARTCATLSRVIPRRIVACSEEARRAHVALGYDASRIEVIPNGFEAFAVDRAVARAELRRELHVEPHAPVVLLAARWDPQKDHRNFVDAADLLLARRGDVEFVLCGTGVDAGNDELTAWIGATRDPRRFHLLGRRADIVRLDCAADVAVSSSRYGEGFPNSIGEAMVCATPVVSTRVGASPELVGDERWVVPPADPRALAEAMGAILGMSECEWQAVGSAAREHVEREYDIDRIAQRYFDLYRAVVAGAA